MAAYIYKQNPKHLDADKKYMYIKAGMVLDLWLSPVMVFSASDTASASEPDTEPLEADTATAAASTFDTIAAVLPTWTTTLPAASTVLPFSIRAWVDPLMLLVADAAAKPPAVQPAPAATPAARCAPGGGRRIRRRDI